MQKTNILAVGLLLSICAPAANIQFATHAGYVFESGSLLTTLSSVSPGYTSTLDANNFGGFQWSYINSTVAALNNVSFILFLDADLDRNDNTFFNEYGEFISVALPPAAPGGAVAASSWEIDEPGFVFGDIMTNALADSLDNANGTSPVSPDDASLALRFTVASLLPGETLNANFLISASDIGGLRQVDPDSLTSFYLNGYLTVGTAPTGGAVPEPSSAALLVGAAMVWYVQRRRRL